MRDHQGFFSAFVVFPLPSKAAKGSEEFLEYIVESSRELKSSSSPSSALPVNRGASGSLFLALSSLYCRLFPGRNGLFKPGLHVAQPAEKRKSNTRNKERKPEIRYRILPFAGENREFCIFDFCGRKEEGISAQAAGLVSPGNLSGDNGTHHRKNRRENQEQFPETVFGFLRFKRRNLGNSRDSASFREK